MPTASSHFAFGQNIGHVQNNPTCWSSDDIWSISEWVLNNSLHILCVSGHEDPTMITWILIIRNEEIWLLDRRIVQCFWNDSKTSHLNEEVLALFTTKSMTRPWISWHHLISIWEAKLQLRDYPQSNADNCRLRHLSTSGLSCSYFKITGIKTWYKAGDKRGLWQGRIQHIQIKILT